MKYICLGYINEKAWESASEAEQKAMMDECFAYDEELKKNGHIVGGEALQGSKNATTLRWRNMILEATDLNHAIRLLSNHPSVRLLRERGCWEIRPAADLGGMIEESERRRGM
jgi:hypothetical protein